nr:MAG TPA: hypothetical protein [Caudoviricetes sp.]
MISLIKGPGEVVALPRYVYIERSRDSLQAISFYIYFTCKLSAFIFKSFIKGSKIAINSIIKNN